MVVVVETVLFQHTDPQQVVDHLLRLFYGHVIPLSELGRGQRRSLLLEAEQKLDLIQIQDAVQNPEVHVVLFHLPRKRTRNIVRDHLSKLNYVFFLLRVVAVVIYQREIPFIRVNTGVHIFWHNTILPK